SLGVSKSSPCDFSTSVTSTTCPSSFTLSPTPNSVFSTSSSFSSSDSSSVPSSVSSLSTFSGPSATSSSPLEPKIPIANMITINQTHHFLRSEERREGKEKK